MIKTEDGIFTDKKFTTVFRTNAMGQREEVIIEETDTLFGHDRKERIV